jgi:hypothetical protein
MDSRVAAINPWISKQAELVSGVYVDWAWSIAKDEKADRPLAFDHPGPPGSIRECPMKVRCEDSG